MALGYNAVDNEFFGEIRNAKWGMGNRGVLTMKHTKFHESGERGAENFQPLITQIDTDKGRKGEAGLGLAGQAGAAFSNPSTSELARDSENTPLSRSASGPASSLDSGRSTLDYERSKQVPCSATDGESLRGGNGTERSPSLQRGTMTLGPYFLASNRFVERKNLSRLIEAYEIYAKRATGRVWPLVLLGDGELRGELEEKAEKLKLRKAKMGEVRRGTSVESRGADGSEGEAEQKLKQNFEPLITLINTDRDREAGLRPGSQAGASEPDSLQSKLADSPVSESRTRSASLPSSSPATSHALPATAAEGGLVVFAGFRQVEEIREFYAGAGVFIHPALAEPWGLVINEAMASGLPVLSSRNVGAAEELVHEGVNGFLFDPLDVEEMAGLLGQMAGMPVSERLAMGRASRGIVANWGPGRFAEGVREAVGMAMGGACRRVGFLDRMLLEVLIRK